MTAPHGFLCQQDAEFGPRKVPCTRPATVRITISGTHSFNTSDSPACDTCARIAERVITKYFPSATFSSRQFRADELAGPR